MIKDVTITQVHIAEKGKNGKPFGKTWGGKFIPSKRIAIKIEGDDNWYSDFMDSGDVREAWQPGMRAKVVLFEKNGYKNFKMPEQIDYLAADVEWLKVKVNELLGTKAGNYSEALDEIQSEDLPF